MSCINGGECNLAKKRSLEFDVIGDTGGSFKLQIVISCNKSKKQIKFDSGVILIGN